MVYLVTYDLNKAGKDYNGVYQAIKDASIGVWCHPLDSTWLICSNYASANAVFEKIKPYMDSDDELLVVQVTENMQGYLEKEQWDYIHNSIFK